jgi:hypothetical protein
MCNSELFAHTPLVLFLNKSDLFREKLARVDLSVCFPEYKGGNDYEKAVSANGDAQPRADCPALRRCRLRFARPSLRA